MFRRFTNKRALVALAAVAALAVAGIAYGFLSATGEGSGTGSVTAKTATLVLTSSALSFAKLEEAQTVTVSAHNPGTSPEKVTTVAVSASSTDSTTCPDGSFTAGTVSTTPTEVQPGETVAVATVPVTLHDLPVAQDGCIGSETATLTLGSSS